MKHKIIGFILPFSFLCLLSSGSVFAIPTEKRVNKSTNIYLCKSYSDWLSLKHPTYTVQCSNGNTTRISSWKKKNQWCVGTQQHQCFTQQLTAANIACSQTPPVMK